MLDRKYEEQHLHDSADWIAESYLRSYLWNLFDSDNSSIEDHWNFLKENFKDTDNDEEFLSYIDLKFPTLFEDTYKYYMHILNDDDEEHEKRMKRTRHLFARGIRTVVTDARRSLEKRFLHDLVISAMENRVSAEDLARSAATCITRNASGSDCTKEIEAEKPSLEYNESSENRTIILDSLPAVVMLKIGKMTADHWYYDMMNLEEEQVCKVFSIMQNNYEKDIEDILKVLPADFVSQILKYLDEKGYIEKGYYNGSDKPFAIRNKEEDVFYTRRISDTELPNYQTVIRVIGHTITISLIKKEDSVSKRLAEYAYDFENNCGAEEINTTDGENLSISDYAKLLCRFYSIIEKVKNLF